ncbi:MAG: PEP-CTERM sorting domain-containing protein [Verrucomicrobiota bacterium]
MNRSFCALISETSFVGITISVVLWCLGATASGFTTAASAFQAAGDFNGVTTFSFDSATDGSPVSSSGTETYDFGTAPNDDENSVVFSGSSSAQALPQTLRAQASGTVVNIDFDSDYDADNQIGIPDNFVSFAQAEFTETLQYGGTATNYNSRYILQFTGTLTGDAFAFISLRHGSNPEQTWFFDQPGTYNVPLNSTTFVHGNSPQEFRLFLSTGFDIFSDSFPPSSTISGSANFGNTLQVTGIDLRDNVGNLLTADSVTGSSGSTFNIVPVPEPGTPLLLLTVGAAFLAKRRRKSC